MVKKVHVRYLISWWVSGLLLVLFPKTSGVCHRLRQWLFLFWFCRSPIRRLLLLEIIRTSRQCHQPNYLLVFYKVSFPPPSSPVVGSSSCSKSRILTPIFHFRGGLARRETGRYPGRPLLQEVFRFPGRTREFISLKISWNSWQTGSACVCGRRGKGGETKGVAGERDGRGGTPPAPETAYSR